MGEKVSVQRSFNRWAAAAFLAFLLLVAPTYWVMNHSSSNAAKKETAPVAGGTAVKAAIAGTQGAASDVCDSLIQRTNEIDSGAKREDDNSQGAIKTVDSKHPSDEYKQLKDCVRKASDSETTFDYEGLRLGMTAQELVQALFVRREAPADGHWLIENEAAVPFDPNSPSNVREVAILTRCSSLECLTTGDSPDLLEAYLDGATPDAKLLEYELTESRDVAVFKTPSSLIRFERSSSGLELLGPPDEADETKALWDYYDNSNKLSRDVTMRVKRKGSEFELTVEAMDYATYWQH
jgi:hypothetical protein